MTTTTAQSLNDLRILRRNCTTSLFVAERYADAEVVAAFVTELAALNAAIRVALFDAAFGR